MLEPVVDALRAGDAGEAMRDFLELAARSAVVRQAAALVHACRAAEEQAGRNVATLVRPAVEELIALNYLASIDRADAIAYVLLKSRLDVADALDAQHRLFTDSADRPGTIPPIADSERDEVVTTMVELARRHGWPIRGKGDKARSHGPTMAMMAGETGHADLYDYLYGAASRMVHFSPSELLRRCWFDRNLALDIGGDSLEAWWASFAVGWGAVLLAETTAIAIELTGSEVSIPAPPGGLGDLVRECSVNIPVLVTQDELNLAPYQR
jgi:hypothetical protein